MTILEFFKTVHPSVLAAKMIFKYLKEHYPVLTVSDIADTTSGGTPNRGIPEYYNGDIPWVKSGELKDGLITKCDEFITEEGLNNSSAKLFSKGTLLVAMYGANIGKTGVLDFDATTNQAVCAVFPKIAISRDYLYWYFKQQRIDFIAVGKGGAQPNISQTIINNALIVVPEEKIQEKIVEFLMKIEKGDGIDYNFFIPEVLEDVEKIYKYKKSYIELSESFELQLTLLDNLNQAILQDAVQGKLLSELGREGFQDDRIEEDEHEILSSSNPKNPNSDKEHHTHVDNLNQAILQDALQGKLLSEFGREGFQDDRIEEGKHKILSSSNPKNLNSDKEQLTLVDNLNQALLQDAVQGKLLSELGKEGFQDDRMEEGENRILQSSNPMNSRHAVVTRPNTDNNAHDLLKRIKIEKAKSGKKEKPLPSIKPEEIPFDIPDHWVWCRLGEICEKIGSGSTPKGSNYSRTGIPFFRSQNIYNDGLIYEDIKFISGQVQQQMNGTIVKANDILLNITGGSMGRCALVPNEFEEGNVSQHVCIIRPLQVDKNYFHKIILSPFFQKFIFSSTTGAGREGLPKYNLEQFVIPIPPLSEQKRIVAEIEKQFSKTKQLKEHIIANQKATEQLLKALLHGAFEQGEGVG